MPPSKARRKRGGARADVGGILDETDFLPRFLAEGLVSWLTAGDATPRERGATAATMRALCKDVRAAVDKELTKLMQALKECIISARECSGNLRLRTAARDEPGVKLEKANLQLELGKVERTAAPCFGKWLVRQIKTDVTQFSGITARLLAHPGTFLAMAQQRCQLSLRDPNVCSVGHFVCNFTTISTREGSVCVYARPRARDCMLHYTSQFLQNPGSGPVDRHNLAVARAMMRMRGVYFPCRNFEICAAFGVLPGFGCLPELFAEKHPHFDPLMSVEGLLRLSPQETARAKAAVAFEEKLALERKRKAAEVDREHMEAAVDEHLRASKLLPGICSLEALGKSCSGMEKCVRVMVGRLHPGHLSPMDSNSVRNALGTARAFLREVTAFQKPRGGVSSSQAYDFVSGMHVGHYSAPSGESHHPGEWPTWHDGLNLAWVSDPDVSDVCTYRMKGIDLALRFFDSLENAGLERVSQFEGMVPRYRLEAGGRSVAFDANWVDCWDACLSMQIGVQRLVRGSGLDPASWSVPPLSKKDFTSYQRLRTANRVEYSRHADSDGGPDPERPENSHVHAYVRWVERVFAMLVSEPATRCAALSVAGLSNCRLLAAVQEGPF